MIVPSHPRRPRRVLRFVAAVLRSPDLTREDLLRLFDHIVDPRVRPARRPPSRH